MIVFVQKLSPCDLQIFDSSRRLDFGLPKLASGQEEGGELATMSLEFENLHQKSQCEMLIGGDDISNDVITLGACLHVFFNVCFHSPSFLLCADCQKSNSLVDREPQGNWRQNSNSRDIVASSPSFSHPATRVPWRACSQANSTV